MSQKKILIAKVVSVFGVKGEVKIMSYCQNPSDLAKYPLFDKNEQKVKIKIRQSQKGQTDNNLLIATINEINDRNQAELWRGKELFVERQNLKDLPEDEFYYADLVGLDVLDDKTQEKIGKIVAINDFGAGGIVEIEFLQKEKNQITDFLFENEIFPQVNVKGGFVTFIMPKILE